MQVAVEDDADVLARAIHDRAAGVAADDVSTADIIGGNSGSPVVNRAGEYVGIIFDGNLQSLPWDYAFGEKQGRATSVHSASMYEALTKVYGAKDLAAELVAGKRTK